MVIEVLLFGPQALLAGSRSVIVDTGDGPATVAGVRTALCEARPQVAESVATSRWAVNLELVDESAPVRPGDEVAVIGMVSGG